jgi:hypothetical protein
MDRLLDQARYGPAFLQQPEIAKQVLASVEYGVQRGDYELHAWVIMPIMFIYSSLLKSA